MFTIFEEYYMKWVEFESNRAVKPNPSNLSFGINHIFPFVKNKQLQKIDQNDIAKILNNSYKVLSGATVTKIKNTLDRFFTWCLVNQYIEEKPFNPKSIHYLIDAKQKASDPHPALALKDVHKFVKKFYEMNTLEGYSILFTLLTASRIGNVIGSMNNNYTQPMKWSDIKDNVWIIPSSNMKCQNGDHYVPLSKIARHILKKVQDLNGQQEFVFSGIDYHTVRDCFMKICGDWVDSISGKPIHIHGLRSTFKTWGTENGIDYVMTEMALHHRIDPLKYDRSKAIKRRQKIMEKWSEFCFNKISI